MSRPEHMSKNEFVLYWDAKPVGKIYVGRGFYTFEKAKKKWNIIFAETTPIEIKQQIENEFIHQTIPSSSHIIVSSLQNYESALYSRLFETHDEITSCINFPENCYKKITDPLLKRLVKEKISEWANSREYFGEGLTKKLLKELAQKIEEIDRGENALKNPT